jgi:23S rRNA pseudouridine955/2504/2580 synthase
LPAHTLDETGPPRYLIRVVQEIAIAADESPKKLANILKKHFPIGYVRKLFRKNGVKVNDNRCKADTLVRAGDRIQLYIPFEEGSNPDTESARTRSQLAILFENANIAIIDKPAGISVHEGRGVLKRHSVLGILEARYRSQGITPRLVHRLDRDTSGVLVVAKNETIAKQLEEYFQNRKVEKEYLCLVAGRLQQDEGVIDFPLPGRQERAVNARTRFRVLRRFSETTLVRVNISTGRMHQIRLHFANYGHPVVMDDQHGDFAFNKRFRKQWGLQRQFLHASTVTLEHDGRKRTWKASLPADLAKMLELLAVD